MSNEKTLNRMKQLLNEFKALKKGSYLDYTHDSKKNIMKNTSLKRKIIKRKH